MCLLKMFRQSHQILFSSPLCWISLDLSKGSDLNKKSGQLLKSSALKLEPLSARAVNLMESHSSSGVFPGNDPPAWQAASQQWSEKFSQRLDSIGHLHPPIYDYSFGEIDRCMADFNANVEARLNDASFNADRFHQITKNRLSAILPSTEYIPQTFAHRLDSLMQWMDTQGKELVKGTAKLPHREQKVLEATYNEWQLNLHSQLIINGIATSH